MGDTQAVTLIGMDRHHIDNLVTYLHHSPCARADSHRHTPVDNSGDGDRTGTRNPGAPHLSGCRLLSMAGARAAGVTPPRADRTAHSGAHQTRRKAWAPLVAQGVVCCWRCGQPIRPDEPWDLGHHHPFSKGGADEDTSPEHRWPTGGCVGNRNAKARTDVQPRRFFDSPTSGPGYRHGPESPLNGRPRPGLDGGGPGPAESDQDGPALTPGPADSVWDRADWLAELREIPENAAWPRLMLPPHPAAAGSYGAEAVRWARDTWDLSLRWWQCLALARLLEHDGDGNLVWPEALVSTARQVGKSILLRGLAGWRQHAAPPELAGDDGGQLIMHTGRDLSVCRNVQRPVRTWAKVQGGYTVREANGADEVQTPDGLGRWLIRSQGGVYGFTVDLGLVDEAWDVAEVHVAEGLEPTLVERPSGQLVLFSTAHRKATTLVLERRDAALAEWDPEAGSLILEWSAPPELADLSDRAAWRLASPHWTPGRERLLDRKLARVLSGAGLDVPGIDTGEDPATTFRTQYLNQWPATGRAGVSGRDEPVCDVAAWHAAGAPELVPGPGPVSVAVEDYYGLGCAAAAAQAWEDGRVFTWGSLYATRADAYRWAAWLTGARPGSVLLVGASLLAASAADQVPAATVVAQASTQTRTALPLIRELLDTGRLVHAGTPALATQVETVRVVPSTGGGLLPARGTARSDLLRATAWAVQHATLPREQPNAFFVY